MIKFILLAIFTTLVFQQVESNPLRFFGCIDLIFRRSQKSSHDRHFSYDDRDPNGPSNWPGACNTGQSQSPIAYDQVPSIPGTPNTELRMIGAFNTRPREVHVINSGHGATWSFVYADNAVPQITGGPLNNEVYNFAQFHFHYPCEHLPNKFRRNCKLELHYVHFNSKYGNITNAVNKPDGLAVIGVMYDVSLLASSHRFQYLSMLPRVYQPDTEYTETRNVFTYADAVGFTKIPKIISYKGSLTTPGCCKSCTFFPWKLCLFCELDFKFTSKFFYDFS